MRIICGTAIVFKHMMHRMIKLILVKFIVNNNTCYTRFDKCMHVCCDMYAMHDFRNTMSQIVGCGLHYHVLC